MELRANESYQTFVSDFLRFDILVACPNCSKKAVVKTGKAPEGNNEITERKVICVNCGYNKKLTNKPSAILYSSDHKSIKGKYIVIGGAVDPFFYLPLWLKTDFEQHTFWAYNFEHLDFLREHIEAKLRERNGQERYNSSLGSRLPKWMTSKKNREILLKKISELETK
jgi:Zn ribbon nucleic-acid-binding protein